MKIERIAPVYFFSFFAQNLIKKSGFFGEKLRSQKSLPGIFVASTLRILTHSGLGLCVIVYGGGSWFSSVSKF